MPSKLIKANCSFCNKEFQRGKYDIERTLKRSGNVYCSIKCSKTHFREASSIRKFSQTKNCTKCKEEKPRDSINFPLHNQKLDGLDSWCRKCRASYRSEINRGKFRGQLLDDEVRELRKQEKCDICGGTENSGSRNNKHLGKLYSLVMDHNHETGKFRGMLCNHCNRGLGNFKDGISNLEMAIKYLKDRNI
jgi:hypothetical protein